MQKDRSKQSEQAFHRFRDEIRELPMEELMKMRFRHHAATGGDTEGRYLNELKIEIEERSHGNKPDTA